MSTLQTTILKHPDSASNNIQVDANGDVGIKNSASSLIGAVTNAATLVVGDGASSEGITIYTGASNAGELAFADGIVGSATQRGRILYSHGDNSMRISTNGAEHVRILNNGNFGIGESSPQYKLHVKDGSGTAYRNLAWFQGKGTHATAGFERAVALGASNAGAHIDGWNGTSGSRGETFLLLQSAGGNVAIGTSSPYSASGYNSLTLNGSTGSQIRFRTGDSDKGLIYNTANDFNIFSFDNPLRFHTNSTEQMRLDSSGRLLVGTSTARTNFNNGGNSAEFQVEGFGKGSFMRNLNDQFGASLFLTKSRSTGNSVLNSSDTIGNISFQGNDGTDFVPTAIISCQVDGTPGANDMPGRLVFSTTADGSSSPTERMRIDHTGTSFFMSAGNVIGALTDLGAGTTRRLYYGGHSRSGIGTNHVTFTVWTNGDVQNTNNSYGSLSDVKLKENIVDAKSQWADIKDLRVRNYNFIEGQTHTQIGVVAQEVETVSPGLVYETPDRDENDNDLGTVTKSVNYSVLYMKAVKALQEAMERIETLETKVAALEAG